MSDHVRTKELLEWCRVPVAELASHPRLRLPLRLVKDSAELGELMAGELVDLVAANNAAGRPTRVIVPCGPACWYAPWTRLVNERGVSLAELEVFHMDECLDWQGRPLPQGHPYNFRTFMEARFYGGNAIVGGGLVGLELAEFLVKRGRKVIIVDTSEKFGELMPIRNWMKLSKWLGRKGVAMIGGIKKYVEITDKGLIFIDKDGNQQVLEADTIVTALPLKANTELVEALKGKVRELYTIGDCKEPRLILHAVADGYNVAQAV